MSPEVTGAIGGASIGILSFVFIRVLADKLETGKIDAGDTRDQNRKTAGILRSLAWLDIVIFAVIGYFVGPYIF